MAKALTVLMPVLALGLACAGSELATRKPRELRLKPGDGVKQPTPGDLGKVFHNVDEAALAACDWLWKNKPGAHVVEYCGVIFQDVQGIKAGLPVPNGNTGNCTIPLEPPGTTSRGDYHSHLVTEEFSDVDTNTRDELAHYLCSPSGGVLKFIAGQGTERLR